MGRGKRGQAEKAEAASAWHCQLKLTVKQTTQQGHLSSDNSKRKVQIFRVLFSSRGLQSQFSLSELINHLLCVSFIFTMPRPFTTPLLAARVRKLCGNGGRKSFSKDMIMFATSQYCFYTQSTLDSNFLLMNFC